MLYHARLIYLFIAGNARAYNIYRRGTILTAVMPAYRVFDDIYAIYTACFDDRLF